MKDSTTVKRCCKCKQDLPVSAFSKRAKSKDGLQLRCMTCDAAYAAAHREEARARSAAWRKRNPEKERARYADHRYEVLSRQAAYRAANPEKERAYYAAYRADHREERRARSKAYQKAHPEAKRAKDHRRRARKLNSGGSHTAAQVKELLQKQKGKCVYCKSNIRKCYHVDHIVALVRGGSNDIGNIQLTCPTCNYRKHAKDNIEFAQQLGMLL